MIFAAGLWVTEAMPAFAVALVVIALEIAILGRVDGVFATSDTDWDIAFRATDIIINGGVSSGLTDEPTRTGIGAAYLAIETFADLETVDTSLLEQDSVNGFVLGNWDTYTGDPFHLIVPTPGRILVIKTHDGKYAKMEILSYYKDAPVEPDAWVDEERYYTFDFVYQPNEGVITFE